MMKRFLSVFLTLGILLAGCQEKDEPVKEAVPAPKVISSDPSDGSTDLKGEKLAVTVVFDQNVKCSSGSRAQVSIDNDAVIDKIHAYNEKVTVEISGLADGSGKDYTLVIPEGVILGFKENQEPVEEIRINFTMKYVEPYVPSGLDPVKTLVNPKASKEARNVYNFLLEQSGKKTLSGVQSSHSHKNDFVDAVYKHTGKHPALAGYDFLFLQFSPTPDNWSWVQNYNDISAPK